MMKTAFILLVCLWGASAFSLKPGSRIFHGSKAKEGQFPYHVALRVQVGSRAARCGGALITKNIVLTAAHCLSNIVGGTAGLGSTFYGKGKLVSISTYAIHDDYDEETLANDIGIAVLSEDIVPDGKTISIIPIDDKPLEYDASVTVAGYGGVGNGDVSNDLLFVNLKTITLGNCRRYFEVGPKAICCVGENLSSTCEGDSGSPLVKKNDKGVDQLVGLVSFSDENCEKGWPNVFTRVESFKDWIQEQIDIVNES